MIIALLLAYVTINGGLAPHFFDTGVSIRSVITNSSAHLAGIANPDQNVRPMEREYITRMDAEEIKDTAEYNNFLNSITEEKNIVVRTNKAVYNINYAPGSDIGLRVYNKPTNNLKKGLEISGGTRVLLTPIIDENKTITRDDFELIKENIEKRLNVYGLSDTTVRIINDKPAVLGGKAAYISAELSGANENEISGLISNQGKFEAKIGNNTVFYGGKDIANICRSAQCAGIDPYNPCADLSDGSGVVCRYSFQISLSLESAERFAEATKDLDLIANEDGSKSLSQKIDFYLDNSLTNSLSISGSLKGQAAVDVQITGSGIGRTQEEAVQNALLDMKELQSVLSTGSLPFKLKVVNTNLISPSLGADFLNNTLLIGLIGVLAVALMIFIRYRIWYIVIPIMITLFSEILLLLGMTALIGSTLDLAAIAGIIVTIGTGTNDQIVMIDETLKNRHKKASQDIGGSFLSNLKNAFFIIFSAYATIVVAMIPLLFAGAGLLQGFAITTILGASLEYSLQDPHLQK